MASRELKNIETSQNFTDDNAGWNSYQDVPQVKNISRALTGVVHNSSSGTDSDYADPRSRWLQRRHVTSTLVFDTPWAGRAIAEEGEEPGTFTQYITLDYNHPNNPLETRTRVDVTRRGPGMRLTPADDSFLAPSGLGLLQDAGAVLMNFGEAALEDPSTMEETLIEMLGQDIWKPK